MLMNLFSRRSTSVQNIGIKDHLQAIDKLHSAAVFSISNMLNQTTLDYNTVILVSIERGGNIPATLLNYSLAEAFKEDIKKGLLQLHSLHVNLATRDKKPGTNKQALHKLKEEIDAIVAHNPAGVTEGGLKIYFVEDLLDSGTTLNLLNKTFKSQMWFGGGISTLLVCYAKEALEHYTSKDLLIRLKAGKILHTRRWLRFWYDGTSN